jgi:hypothetical protein
MGNLRKDEAYDARQAYNKNLTPSERFNYLKNERHDHNMAAGKMLSNASPAKNQNKGYADSRELTDMPLTKDMTGGRGTSWMSKHATQRFSAPTKMVSPLNQYDDVVLGGNKGDKSKTKPGEKDYEDKK